MRTSRGRSGLIAAMAAACLTAGCATADPPAAVGMTGASSAVTSQATARVRGHPVAYRTLGTGQPIVLLQRFRGTMDDWDPAFLEQLAATGRQVILFDNLGVGESGGSVPDTLEAAADDAAEFIRALGLRRVPVLGWSMGGMTAQVLAIRHPDLVSHLVLAGTAPAGGAPEVVHAPREWVSVATKPDYRDDDVLFLFYTDSASSRTAGRASLARMTRGSQNGSAVKTSAGVMQAQAQAVVQFARNEGGWYQKLREIRVPTLVANGDRDRAFAAIDSVVLAREIPGAQLALYPDAGHAFHFQYPRRFAQDVHAFLASH